MHYKEDWILTQKKFKSWWAGELKEQPIIQVTSPRRKINNKYSWDIWTLIRYRSNPAIAIAEFEKYCQNTFFGGESFPNFWINLGPGCMAAYLGVTPRITQDTVWIEDSKDWKELWQLKIAPDNAWWKLTREVASLAVEKGAGKFFVGMPDMGGPMDIAASLRGTNNLLSDLMENPESVKKLTSQILELWFHYYDNLYQIIHAKMKGVSSWMGIWSPKRWYPIQCDFSAMISPKMFEEFVIPDLEKQCRYLDHTIYHLDGPEQITHLDLLLDIPELDGIQWSPGAANPPVGSSKWFPLYRRIQKRNKLLVLLGIARGDIELLLSEISPYGLLLSVNCDSEEAKELLKNVDAWTAER